MTSMDTEYTEEEVVENPTLKAAYNLAPLHQNQPLRWDYEVDLIGKKVFDKVLHLCEVCELPILVYGRLLPCKHIFCFLCARKCESTCKRCVGKVQKVEELALGTVYVCIHGAPKHSTNGCRRTYLSQRDLQSHIAHRHFSKPSSNESKASSNSQQPQLPLTQQQAAALQQQHVSSQAATTPHNQSNLLPSMHNQQQQQHILSSSTYIQQHHQQLSPHDIGNQLLTPNMPTLGSTSVSPAMSQASPDPKSNPLVSHGMAYNTSLQSNDQQGVYRPVDTSLPHQFQHQQIHNPHQSLQQQQQQLQHQQHLHLPISQHQQQQQQPPTSQMMRHSGSPGMSSMSKPIQRFNPPLQSSMSSTMMPMQGSRGNPFQATASGSSAEMQMSTQIHRQQPPRQNVNMHQQQQQQQQQQMMLSHSSRQSQHLVHKNYNDLPSEMDSYERMQNMDTFGNPRQISNVNSNDNMLGSGMQNVDNFSSMHQQRKLFNPLQDVDDRERDFNSHQPSLMDTSNSMSSAAQAGQSSRNKNVNLITVPIQDEGQFRPLPYVNQSQLPPGAAGLNKNFAPFSSGMSLSNNPSSNFSSTTSNQTMGNNMGNIRAPHRMPFNRPTNPQSHMSGPDSPQGSMSTNMMLNNPRGVGAGGGGRLTLGGNMPPKVQGALAGAVQALSRGAAPLHTSHNPRFNAPPNSGHWSPSGGIVGGINNSGNLRPIQPRMTQNLPPRGAKNESQFKQQGYYR